jgi:hypothetical protein
MVISETKKDPLEALERCIEALKDRSKKLHDRMIKGETPKKEKKE